MTINKKFATLYLLINSNEFIRQTEVITILQPFLTEFQTNQAPVISNFIVEGKPDEDLDSGLTVTSGPFKGTVVYSGNVLSAIKWNIQSKNDKDIPESLLGSIRDTFRKSIKPIFLKQNFDVIQMSLNSYGLPLAGDKGVPPTPKLPSIPLPVIPTVEKSPIVLPPVTITAERPADMNFTFAEIDAYNKRVPKKSYKSLWILAVIMGLYAARRGM